MPNVVSAAIQSESVSFIEEKLLSLVYQQNISDLPFMEENTRQCKGNYEGSVILKWNALLH